MSVATGETLEVSEWYKTTSLVGYSLLIVVGTIVSIVLLASIFTTPRKSKVTALFFALFIMIPIAFLIFSYLGGILFSILMS